MDPNRHESVSIPMRHFRVHSCAPVVTRDRLLPSVHCLLSRALCLLSSVFWLHAPVLAAAGAGAALHEISPAAFAGSSVNVVAGLQNTLFTQGDSQYAAFYANDATLVLAQRPVTGGEWKLRRTNLRANVHDAHRTVAIAVDGDGFLHVAWDHHNNPLNYARGVAPGSLELGSRLPMTGAHESRVSYPQFLPLPNGDLLFFFRDGGSGRGNLVLNRYATRERRWTQVHSKLIDGEGQRSAYPAMAVDRKGVLHLAWNWRETPDVATNHDLCYARSADGGVSWTTSTGEALAVPFTATNAEYALRIPQGRTLMNPPSLAVDARGRPIIANYWCPEGSDIPQYHVLRFDGKVWRASQVTNRQSAFSLAGGGTKRPPISRSVLLPVLVPHFRQTLHLVYRDDERDGRIVVASCPDLDAAAPRWTESELTTGSVGAWEPSLDPVAAAHGRLEMLVQRVEQRDGNDREAAAVPATPISSLSWDPHP